MTIFMKMNSFVESVIKVLLFVLSLSSLASGDSVISSSSSSSETSSTLFLLAQSQQQFLKQFENQQKTNVGSNSELLSLGRVRSVYMKSLMFSNPQQALIIADQFYNRIYNDDHNSTLSSSSPLLSYIEELQSIGVIEKYFQNAKIDIAYVCGMKHNNNDNNNNGASSLGFCEERVYVHSHGRSYAVVQPASYPLSWKRTHYNQFISGYILDDSIVLHFPKNVNNYNNYNIKNSHKYNINAVDPDLPTTNTNAISIPSVGDSSILMVNIEFTDQSSWGVQSNSDFQGCVAGLNNRFGESSFGKFRYTSYQQVTVRLTGTVASYGSEYWRMSSEAEAAAINILGSGPYWAFKQVVWQWKGLNVFGWAGLGAEGARGVWNNGYITAGNCPLLLGHELGHNFGLAHAGSWAVPDGSSLSRSGSLVEYGDGFDVMGNAWEPSHYNAFYKIGLKWLDGSVVVATCGVTCSSLTQQIWPYDQAASQTKINLVHLKHDYTNDYLGEYTLQTGTGGSFPNGRWSRDHLGLFVRVLKYEWDIYRSVIINTHLENTNDAYNAALQQGESLNDCQQGIFITNGGFDLCPGQNFNCVNAIVKRSNASITTMTLPRTFALQDVASGQYLQRAADGSLTLTPSSSSAVILTPKSNNNVYNYNQAAVSLLDSTTGFSIRHSSFVLYDRDTFVNGNLDFSWQFQPTNMNPDQYYIFNSYGQPSSSNFLDLVNGQAKITTNANKRVWKVVSKDLPRFFALQDVSSGQYLQRSGDGTMSLTSSSSAAVVLSPGTSNVLNGDQGYVSLFDSASGHSIRHYNWVLFDYDSFVGQDLDYAWLFQSTGVTDQYYIMNYYGQPSANWYVDMVNGQAKITSNPNKRVWKVISRTTQSSTTGAGVGPSWTQVNANTPLGGRRRFGLVSDNKNNLFAFGGLNNGVSTNDIWSSSSSSNYATWTKVGNAAWSPRNYFNCEKLQNGQILLVGGGANDNNAANNEVWISSATNYASWTFVTNGPFQARLSAASVVIGNTFYLFSGATMLGGAPLTDMWSTANSGVSWTQVNAALPNARYFSSLSYVSNTMVVVGGSNNGNTLSDIWLSPDLGLTWSQQTVSTIGNIRSFSTVTYNNVLYIVGGYNFEQGPLNAIYSTTNGKNWISVNSAPGFNGHYEGGLAVVNGKLIKVAGSADSSVWTSDLSNLGKNTWAQSLVLNINVTYTPTNINVGDVVTFSATANDQALISFNFVDEMYYNAYQNIIGPTVQNRYTSAGFKKVVVLATNMLGKVSRFVFSIKVGNVRGNPPSFSSLGYKHTCAANRFDSYDSYVNGIPTDINNLQQ